MTRLDGRGSSARSSGPSTVDDSSFINDPLRVLPPHAGPGIPKSLGAHAALDEVFPDELLVSAPRREMILGHGKVSALAACIAGSSPRHIIPTSEFCRRCRHNSRVRAYRTILPWCFLRMSRSGSRPDRAKSSLVAKAASSRGVAISLVCVPFNACFQVGVATRCRRSIIQQGG